MKHLLVGIDGSDGGDAAVEEALALARDLRATLTFVCVLLALVASAAALATGLGALPVFFLGAKAELLRPILLGGTIGAMTVASILGLFRPALQEGGPVSVAAGAGGGLSSSSQLAGC